MIRRRMKKQALSPKNITLQQEGHQEKDIRDDLNLLKEKTKRIHIGWLFDTKGRPALRDVCRMLDSTVDSVSVSGWQDLAYELKLDSQTVGCIKNRRFHGETETYYTLLTAAHNDEQTLDQLLEALKEIGRLDAVQNSCRSIERLATDVLEDESNSRDSSSASDHIIKPSYIPKLPSQVLLLHDSLDSTGTITESDVQEFFQQLRQLAQPTAISRKLMEYSDQPRCESELVTNAALTVHGTSPEIQRNVRRLDYDCTVMLTFATDGEEYLLDIVKSLRQERKDGQRIGVLILEEHSTLVEENPQQFILNLFQQVNYVMPVITDGYLKSVGAISSKDYLTGDKYMDTKWTRYIYTLMNLDYIKRGCLNTKIRCLVPDNFLYLTQRHRRMREPIFETWNRVSEIDKVGTRLLANRRRYKLSSFARGRVSESVKN